MDFMHLSELHMQPRPQLSALNTVVCLRPFPLAKLAIRLQLRVPAVSDPGVGRFRRAETGILGVERNRGPGGAP
jgi:hypothetical protein